MRPERIVESGFTTPGPAVITHSTGRTGGWRMDPFAPPLHIEPGEQVHKRGSDEVVVYRADPRGLSSIFDRPVRARYLRGADGMWRPEGAHPNTAAHTGGRVQRPAPVFVPAERSIHQEQAAAEIGLTLPPRQTKTADEYAAEIRAARERLAPSGQGTGNWLEYDGTMTAIPLHPWHWYVSPEVLEKVMRENSYVAVMRQRTMARALKAIGASYPLHHDV